MKRYKRHRDYGFFDSGYQADQLKAIAGRLDPKLPASNSEKALSQEQHSKNKIDKPARAGRLLHQQRQKSP